MQQQQEKKSRKILFTIRVSVFLNWINWNTKKEETSEKF